VFFFRNIWKSLIRESVGAKLSADRVIDARWSERSDACGVPSLANPPSRREKVQ
jgi:hypothetical protein